MNLSHSKSPPQASTLHAFSSSLLGFRLLLEEAAVVVALRSALAFSVVAVLALPVMREVMAAAEVCLCLFHFFFLVVVVALFLCRL